MSNKCIKYISKECCGCGICAEVCPQKAILMEENQCGFTIPRINHKVCINCGRCDKVCAFIHYDAYLNKPANEVYAAAIKDKEAIKISASGGVFFGFAKYILKENGIVYGAAWTENFSVKHIGVEKQQELRLLQGSKYTQSNITGCLSEVKKNLELGREVLFSGTPCQIAALRAFLGKDYPNLLTLDLICHGVGSNKFVQEDVKYLEQKYQDKVKFLVFRSKRKGWGTSGDIVFENKIKDYTTRNSPYYYYYLQNAIFRESCYECPFSCDRRTGDISIGDFWRVESVNIDMEFDYYEGISCLLVNTEKGHYYLEKVKSKMNLARTDLDEVKKRNANLVAPCKKPDKREKLLKIYINDGYNGIIKYWNQKEIKMRCILLAKSLIPRSFKIWIKKILRK